MLLASKRIGIDTVSSVLAIAIPALASLVCLPGLVEHLGIAGFGVLAIAWALLGYASVFELGLSRALTLVVTQFLARDDCRSSSRVSLHGLILLTALGVAGAALTLPLGLQVLTTPESMQATHQVWVVPALIALAVPAVTLFSGCRGILEAHNAFSVSNLVRMLVGAATYVGPWWAAAVGSLDLVGAIAALAAVRILGAFAMLLVAASYLSPARFEVSSLRGDFARLFSYGKWITLSNVVGPLMINMDRVIVGWILGAAATGKYSAPQDLLSRASSLSGAFAGVLFPVLARLRVRQLVRVADRVLRKSWNLLAYPAIAGFVLLIAVLPTAIPFWIPSLSSPEVIFAAQLLSVGALANTLAQLPAMALQSGGRPDLNAKLHVVEVVPFALLTISLLYPLGIVGAALAWAIRATVDCAALIVLSKKVGVLRPTRVRMSLGLAVGTALTVSAMLPLSPALMALLCSSVAIASTLLTWFAVTKVIR